MHFVNDLAFKYQAGPFRIAPLEFRWIDNARRAVGSIRLKARCWIGIKVFAGVHAKPVARACANIARAGEIAAWLGCKCTELWLSLDNVFQNQINLRSFWSPNTKMRFVFADQFGANWITTFWLRH